MPSTRVVELKQVLDEAARRGGPADEDEDEGTADEQAARAEAVAAFLAAGAELLDSATPHLWAYHRFATSTFDADEMEDYGIPVLTGAE
jgi:propanediol dehydratase large subunit